MDAISPIEFDEVQEEARYGHMRAEPRDSMLLLAIMRRAAGTDIQVKVRNLSSGGLMAETPSGFLRGESVEVELRGIGIVTGKVAWMANGRVGMTFDWPVDHKLARKPVTGGPQPQLVKTQKTMWRPGF